MCQATKHT